MRQQTTEDDLRDNLSMYEDMVSTIPVGVFRFTMRATGEWQFDFVNSRFCDLTGLNREDVLNNYQNAFRIIHPDDFPEFISLIESVEKKPAPFGWKGRIMVNGEIRWVSLKSKPTIMDNGDIVWSGYFNDITERKRAEEALRDSENRWKFALEGARDGVWDWNAQTNEVFFSKQWKAMLGYQEHEIGTTIDEWDKRVHPDYVERCYADLQRHFGGETPFYENEHRILCKDGSYKWILDRGKVIEWVDDGKPLRVIGTHTDITDRKKAEDALRESEERFRTLAQNAPDAIYVQTQHCFAYLNPMALKLFGAETPDQLLGQPVIDRFDPRRHDIVKERIRLVNEERRSVNMMEAVCLKLDGAPFDVEVSAAPVKWDESDGALVFLRDITKRLELEERLRHNQIMLARTERIAQIGSWEWEVATDSVTWSDELFRIFQLDPTRGAPSFEEQSSIYTPDSMARLREAVGLALSDSIPYELEMQGVRADSETRHLRAIGFPERGPDGRVSHLFGSLNDITDRKRFEEERLEMERKLLHTQKLESLGVMAAGIAHDFNNQLAVVLGNLELALTDQTLDPETLLSIESAVGAARRSADLSRQMQVYTGNIVYFPVDIDLNELLNRNPALKSTVSKYVTLNFETSGALPIIKGNGEQLQRLVMNILVNASEAITDKDGNVTLRTGFMDCDSAYLRRSRLEEKPAPGRFVFLEVSDTGCGMDVMTQHKLFDPFFSTKFTGSGLGMAEVMGITKGHQGAIIVESEVGKGTTVRVFFPALKKAPASPVQAMDLVETKPPALEAVNRRKTILLIEDEAGVRDLVVRRLDLLGYDSIIAEDGEEGVRVFRELMNEIDLVMLDYKMPKMNGVEAFGELIRIKPDVKVILSSGYTEDVVIESFPGQRPACVLHKPYNMADLKAELDRLLGTTG